MTKITMYATNKEGEGFVQEVGQFESIEEVEIHIGHFSDDVVITFFIEEDKQKDDENPDSVSWRFTHS